MTWVGLNFVYLFTQQPAVHRRLFGAYRVSWAARNAAPFVLLNGLIFGAARLLYGATPHATPIVSLIFIAAALALSAIACAALLDAELRRVGIRALQRAALRPRRSAL